MLLGTRNCITYHRKCKPNVNQVPLSLIKIYLLLKKINERIFTDSFFPESYSDVWIYIIREMMVSNIYDVYLPIITSLIIHFCKDRKDQHFVQK